MWENIRIILYFPTSGLSNTGTNNNVISHTLYIYTLPVYFSLHLLMLVLIISLSSLVSSPYHQGQGYIFTSQREGIYTHM